MAKPPAARGALTGTTVTPLIDLFSSDEDDNGPSLPKNGVAFFMFRWPFPAPINVTTMKVIILTVLNGGQACDSCDSYSLSLLRRSGAALDRHQLFPAPPFPDKRDGCCIRIPR